MKTIEIDLNQCLMMKVSDIVFGLGLSKSKSEAKRLIEQGGIRIEGEKVEADESVLVADHVGKVFQRGRRAFVRLAPLPKDIITADIWEFDTDEEGDAFAVSETWTSLLPVVE